MAGWIVSAARRVVEQYGGDTRRIWNDVPAARYLQERLEHFDGIGQKKAAMAVLILERDFGFRISKMSGSEVAYDIHIRRTMLRTGLAERDDRQHMIDVARALNPDHPGLLDNPLWSIGSKWCRPTRPRCAECEITSVCPKLIARADGVRGN